MRSRERVIWDFVQGWLQKAEGDLRAAEILLAAPEVLEEAVAFHCQQAAEKFIKAFLVRHQIEFPKTHDLMTLRKLMSQADGKLAEELAFSDWLGRFAVEARYPGEIIEVGPDTAPRALEDARRVSSLLLDALKQYLSLGKPA